MRYANVAGKVNIGVVKVLQRWRASGGNRNLPVTFAYLMSFLLKYICI